MTRDEFIEGIKHLESSLYRVAKSILRSDADCADAIQETILKAYNGLHKLREPRYFKTWVIRILINECKGMLRTQQRVVPMVDVIEQKTDERYDRIEVQEAVDALDDELRILIQLYYYEDLPVKEIAEVLNTPEGTVKTRLFRARAKLAEFLGFPQGKESLT